MRFTLARYMLRELMVPFLIGTLAVVLMFQANLIIGEFKTFSMSRVPLTAIAQLVLYKTPFFLQLTLPVGVSLAASLAFARLTRESELTAMRAAGAPILKTVLPVAIFGAIIGVANYALVEKVMPKSEIEYRRVQTQVGLLGAMPDFVADTFLKLRGNLVFLKSVSRGPHNTVLFSGIVMVEYPRQGDVSLLKADQGEYKDGTWTLKDAESYYFSGRSLVRATPHKDVVLYEHITVNDIFTQKEAQEQTAAQLKEAIEQSRRLGQDTKGLEVAYHNRFAVPAACLIFAFVAPIFAILFARQGGFFGVLLSIILVFAYYNAWVISSEILGHVAQVPAFVAAWLTNFIFIVIGYLGLRRLE